MIQKNSKFYLAGSAGMLGTDIYKTFSKKYDCFVGDISVKDSHVNFLDFRDFDLYFESVKSFRPSFLCHIGAHTDLEFCEENFIDAYDTNTKSVEYAVEISNQLNIPLVYISTAGIFNGSYDYFTDFDIPSPTGVYARSKFYGENIIKEYSNNYLICRAGWMMGGGESKDKKFIGKILRQLIEGNKTWNIVNDKFGTPTYTVDFAKNLLALIEHKENGLFNLVCSGSTSRLEVANFVALYLSSNFNVKVNINEVNSSFFNEEYFSPRPNNESLINLRLNYKNLNLMKPWQDSLTEYLNEWPFHDYFK
jgi:dTDP-4-dehydrorhamnose reductase